MDDGEGTPKASKRRGAAPVVVEGTVGASVTTDATTAEQDVIVELRHRNDGWTPIRQRAFLRALSETGSVTDACKRVGMSRTSARELRGKSAEFAEAWDKAASIVAPILEQAAFERGVEGWDEPVFQGGKQVGTKRRYSDAALRMLMQASINAKAAGMTMPDLETASIAELEVFARTAAERAGGHFFTRRNQDEIDAALLARLDALANHRRRAVAARGEVWLSGGGYPGDISVAEAAARRTAAAAEEDEDEEGGS